MDDGLLLELHALTLATRSYALLGIHTSQYYYVWTLETHENLAATGLLAELPALSTTKLWPPALTTYGTCTLPRFLHFWLK